MSRPIKITMVNPKIKSTTLTLGDTDYTFNGWCSSHIVPANTDVSGIGSYFSSSEVDNYDFVKQEATLLANELFNHASGYILLNGALSSISASDTATIGTQDFTFESALASCDTNTDVWISSAFGNHYASLHNRIASKLQNVVAELKANKLVTITAAEPGTAYRSIALSTTSSGLTVSDSTLVGGSD